MPTVEILGTASGKSRFIEASVKDLKMNLLDWLRLKEVTIASSCEGEGVCKKCAIQNDWLTCQMTLEQLLQRSPNSRILISYL